MNKYKEEILTYEIYKKQGAYYLSIPVNNLITPKFLIKKDSLYIFLYNHSQCYIIKKISPEIMDAIKSSNCYILENLNYEKPMMHLIKLFP